VYVVAITELAASIDAAALAADLGTTAYDARLLLAPGLPAIARTTTDKAAALDLLARLRARGHGAVACDASAVVAWSEMPSMRRFQLDAGAITLGDRPGERLPYDDVLALLPATHRKRSATITETRERKLDLTRAILTRGLVATKVVKTETRSATDERAAVLYLFRRSGASPWILQEHGTSWAGLGEAPARTAGENFHATVAALRRRAPAAAYDDRLATRKTPEQAALSGGAGKSAIHASTEGAVDLLAHLLALWIAKRAG
jgi:hypothetical protein